MVADKERPNLFELLANCKHEFVYVGDELGFGDDDAYERYQCRKCPCFHLSRLPD